MTTVKLKLSEVLQLEAEINGISNTQTQEVLLKGLISEKLKIKTKYWLAELSKSIAEESKAINALRDETIKKYADLDEEGKGGIPLYINEVKDASGKVISGDINPKFTAFQEEFNSLLAVEKEFKVFEFKLNDFENVETDASYQVFFKLVSPE